jgi:peptidoglycan/LPS O-acetylase OafA/YrhL
VFLLAEKHWFRDDEDFMPSFSGEAPLGLTGVLRWYDDHRLVAAQLVFGIAVGLISLAIAQLSWKVIEVPALRLKKRFEVVHYAGKA